MKETKDKVILGKGIAGKLQYIGSTSIVLIEGNGSRRLSVATVLTEAIDIDTACKYPVDFQANAHRIVKCCNCHNDLLKLCEEFMEKADDGSADFDDPEPGSIYLRAKAVITKANKQGD